MRGLIIHLRKSIKLIVVLTIAFAIIVGILYILYKPMYAVRLNGEIIGYTDAKKQLEEQLEDYKKNGDGDKIAFIEIDAMPEYEMIYSKKDLKADEKAVFDTVIATGTPYYKCYAILVSGEEKYYVETYQEAEKVAADLKEKKSTNADQVSFNAKYTTEELGKTSTDEIVTALFIAPPVEKPKTVATTTKRNYNSYSSSGSVNTSQTVSYGAPALGISLIRPTSGTITSRFGRRSSGTHTGIDIANSKGTPIYAAASGVVSFAGRKGGYGNLVVVDHGNGVQTYYAHNNSLNVSAGQSVSQGQLISYMGSTGNSTGPHLHLEVRVNGVCQNPQNYVY